MPKKGLGRGLGSLFGEEQPGEGALEPLDSLGAVAPGASGGERGVGRLLRVSEVMPNPDQPRKNFDREALDALTDSVRRYGVLQPITVRERAEGGYIIVAGERRWRAAKAAGLERIPALVVDADDRLCAELALIENLQRENLNPIEEAQGYRALIETYGFTQEEVADTVGRGRSTVANSLRLLELDGGVKELVENGKLSAGHARAIASLPAERQSDVAAQAARADMSVRDTERMVRRVKEKERIAKAPPKEERTTEIAQVERYLERLSRTLEQRYERKVRITGAGRQGKIEFEYYSMEDLSRILELFLGMTGGNEQ